MKLVKPKKRPAKKREPVGVAAKSGDEGSSSPPDEPLPGPTGEGDAPADEPAPPSDEPAEGSEPAPE
jgi:hypothetical protein